MESNFYFMKIGMSSIHRATAIDAAFEKIAH